MVKSHEILEMKDQSGYSTTLKHYNQHYSVPARPTSKANGLRGFSRRVGSGRVFDKIPGSGSGSGRVRVSKNTIGYFRVSFLLSGISGYFGYFRVCRVFSGISGFTHIY